MNLKENRIFIAAIALSITIHIYLYKVDFSPDEPGSGKIEIPVTFIPDAKRNSPDKPAKEEKQITLPEDKPARKGYYKSYDKNRLLKKYLELVKDEIDKRKFSPPESVYYGLIGNVTIGFTITGNGSFSGMTVLRSSGDPLLDKTAINAVKDASNKVKRPAAAGRNNIRVNFTVKYQYSL